MHEREPLDDAPRSIASRVFPMALYGENAPEDEIGDVRSSDFGALRREDTWKAYDDALDPATMRVLVVGDIAEKDVLPLLGPTLGAWQAPRKAPPPNDVSPAVATASPRVVVVDRPGAQGLVMVGGEAPELGSPDWAPCVALRFLLGGSHGLLMKAFADAHISATPSPPSLAAKPSRSRAGLLAEVRSDEVAATIAAFLRTFGWTRDWTPPPETMSNVHRVLVDDEPMWRMTLGGGIDVLESLVVHGLPPSQLPGRRAELAAVTADDVRRVAARYFDPARMKIVVVGDWSQMRASVEALGLGPVELRDVEGKVLRVEPGGKP
jgi:zinc protease